MPVTICYTVVNGKWDAQQDKNNAYDNQKS